MQIKSFLATSILGLSAASAYIAPVALSERSELRGPDEWPNRMVFYSRSCSTGTMGEWFSDGGTQGQCAQPPQGAKAINLLKMDSNCRMTIYSDSSCTRDARQVAAGQCVEMSQGIGGYLVDGSRCFGG